MYNTQQNRSTDLQRWLLSRLPGSIYRTTIIISSSWTIVGWKDCFHHFAFTVGIYRPIFLTCNTRYLYRCYIVIFTRSSVITAHASSNRWVDNHKNKAHYITTPVEAHTVVITVAASVNDSAPTILDIFSNRIDNSAARSERVASVTVTKKKHRGTNTGFQLRRNVAMLKLMILWKTIE